MQLTNDQSNALDAIGRWMNNSGEWFFYLGGYAGTGKTTLMHSFINSLGSAPTCLAPTGKAASVLQKRLKEAVVTTIHSALYKPVVPDITKLERLEAELLKSPGNNKLIEEIREEKRRLARLKINFSDNDDHAITPGSLVIVDEASMVTSKMMEDLRRTQAKVLFVGDPGQLPPVGDPGYFTRNKPDAMLSQVMRQALDNPIVGLSMAIRNNERIPQNINNDHIQRRNRESFDIAELQNYEQVLTGKNAIRRKINRIIRKQLGLQESRMPQKGERLICLKNMFKFDNFFVNGIQCSSTSNSDVDNEGNWVVDLLYEGDAMQNVPFYHFPFEVHYNYMAEEDPWPARKSLVELDYGYAITVHKSQGSEWQDIVLVDDHLMEEQPGFRKRWLYTAVTRAKNKLLWVEM